MNLFGAGGHSKVVMDILSSQGIQVNTIYDDNNNVAEVNGIAVLHNSSIESPLIISVGNNKHRKKIAERLKAVFGIAIYSSSIISSSSTIGVGTVIMQGAIIQSGAIIGKHCIINTGAIIDHDCILEDYVHISPNATLCGNVYISEGTQIGAGSILIQNIVIGKWCVIGAGSVVTKNISDNSLAYGNPCKVIKKINLHEF